MMIFKKLLCLVRGHQLRDVERARWMLKQRCDRCGGLFLRHRGTIARWDAAAHGPTWDKARETDDLYEHLTQFMRRHGYRVGPSIDFRCVAEMLGVPLRPGEATMGARYGDEVVRVARAAKAANERQAAAEAEAARQAEIERQRWAAQPGKTWRADDQGTVRVKGTPADGNLMRYQPGDRLRARRTLTDEVEIAAPAVNLKADTMAYAPREDSDCYASRSDDSGSSD